MFEWSKILKAFETHEPLPPLGCWHYGRRFGKAYIVGMFDVERDEDVWKIWFTRELCLPKIDDICFEFRVERIRDEFSLPMKTLAQKAIRFRLLKELRKLANVS